MKTRRHLSLFCAAVSLSAFLVAGDASAAQKYHLRYKFRAGETLRWNVQQRIKMRTIVGGSTQTTENIADSVKAWKVTRVSRQGAITFVHSVESVLMRTKLPGRADTVYDSTQSKTPPVGFEQVAADVGRPLVTITMNRYGKVLSRKDHRVTTEDNKNPMTIPLAGKPVAVGDHWSRRHVISVPRKDKTFKRIKTSQRYTLKKVVDGIATISVETIILTVVRDPAIEAQLMQRETHGTVRFDITRGRVLGQKLNCDKRVIGHISEASSMHYVMSFEEEIIEGVRSARRPEPIGPPPPPVIGPQPPKR